MYEAGKSRNLSLSGRHRALEAINKKQIASQKNEQKREVRM
jgi:hypothetical protein